MVCVAVGQIAHQQHRLHSTESSYHRLIGALMSLHEDVSCRGEGFGNVPQVSSGMLGCSLPRQRQAESACRQSYGQRTQRSKLIRSSAQNVQMSKGNMGAYPGL